MSNVHGLKRSHSHVLDKSDAMHEVLIAANSVASIGLAAELRRQREVTSVVVGTAAEAKQKARRLKQAFLLVDQNLKATVQGTFAIIGATDPELRAKLPAPEAWSSLTGGQQAEHLTDALKKEGGKEVKVFIQYLQAVAEVRRKAEKAWLDVDTSVGPVSAGADEIARLRMLIAQADVMLRALAKPGTALFELFKRAQGIRKKPAASSDKKDAAEGDTKKEPAKADTTGKQPAASTPPAPQPAAPASPAPAATPATAPAGSGSSTSGAATPTATPDAAPALHVGVPASAPTVTNGVHA